MKLQIRNYNLGISFEDSKYRIQGYADTIGIRSYTYNDVFIGYVFLNNTINYFI